MEFHDDEQLYLNCSHFPHLVAEMMKMWMGWRKKKKMMMMDLSTDYVAVAAAVDRHSSQMKKSYMARCLECMNAVCHRG